ncbi:MAG: glycerol-3-phosphate 1-O-acyltransferase PlsY [Alphaproteobacteria bacterium]|nr:glycerol-3-phosphate 1-O-acyltransferase PlsY [Alphaproteobacteria bacterium]MBN2675166.1 glycerol-3-phosphate 1-O-acyltransferase PlsY [Alphaproteobacteria bacterium]
MIYVIGIIISYLLGSIPFGLLIAKAAGKGDLRKVGSGNIGATNVMRAGGLKLAGLVWLLDMAKSIVAVLLGIYLVGESFGALCGFFAIFGHCYPIWLKFKGGKGNSSMFGVLLAISPLSFIICGIEWLFIAFTTGYSSAGAIVGFLILPFLGFAISFNMGLIFIAISALCLWRHKENIIRLVKGIESKIEWKWKK